MFKPMLAPNQEVDLDNIQYPILASYKLDGIRCIFLKGEIVSRSLKPIQNKQLKEKLEPIRRYSEENNLILDGEIYGLDLTFQAITKFVMTQDFEDPKSIKKHGEVLTIPEELKFYCFDCITNDNLDEPYIDRIKQVEKAEKEFKDIFVTVQNYWLDLPCQVDKIFNNALGNGYEGLILREIMGRYKCGRGTIKEGIIYKVKPFRTFDAVVKEITQGTVVDPKAEKKVNELGRSVTSNKKDDRLLVDKIRDFVVDYNGHELKVASSSLTHKEREEYWEKREELIGKTIEYKGMLVGAKDVPRHPVFLRVINPESKWLDLN